MRLLTSILLMMAFSSLLSGCGKDPATMTDAELGLNAQQARGRKVYNIYCLNCHPAYSTHGTKGPGLKGMYKKDYLPSGLTSTDEHVEQSVIHGRGMMPALGDSLDRQMLADLVAYMHTL